MFNFINRIKNKLENKDNLLRKDSRLEERFIRYLNLIDNSNNNKAECAMIFIKIVVEYLNYAEAIQVIEKKENVQNNSSIEIIYAELEFHLGINDDTTILKKIHDDDKKYYKGIKILNSEPLDFHINKIPILLNPWNGDRILDNFNEINEQNKFDGIHFSWNIQNHFLYPMNIVVCNGGNHSQLSARYKNQGTTIINKIKDFTLLYKMLKFDGINYIKLSDQSIIKLNYSREILFYSGVIFELGRYLLKEKYSLLPCDLLSNLYNDSAYIK